MRRVIIESPYAGAVKANVEYARRCVRDSLLRGEAPIASHLLYTQEGILDDDIPEERQQGIDAGLAWRTVAERTVVYTDRGISKGMEYGIAAAQEAGLPIEYRSIESEPRLCTVCNAHSKDPCDVYRGPAAVAQRLGCRQLYERDRPIAERYFEHPELDAPKRKTKVA